MRTGILHAANEGANPVSGFVLVRIPVVVRYPLFRFGLRLNYNHLLRLLRKFKMKLAQIASALDARLENGSPDTDITGLNGIEQAGPSEITFVANQKYPPAAG